MTQPLILLIEDNELSMPDAQRPESSIFANGSST